MKLKYLTSTFILASMLLVGCAAPSSSDTSSSDTSSSDPVVEQWPEELLGQMNTLLGDTLPYIKLADNYYYGIDTVYSDPAMLYIEEDSGTTDYSDQYKPLLIEAGYTFVETDSYGVSYFTKAHTATDYINVQIFLYEGDETTDPGFCIHACISEYVVYLTEWSEAMKTSMNTYIHEVIPFRENTFSTKTEVAYDDEYSYCLYLYDENGDSDTVTNYTAYLLTQGYTAKGNDDDGYVYVKTSSYDNTYEVTLDVYESLFGGVYIDMYYSMIPVASEKWPSAKIDEWFDCTTDVVAVNAADNSFSYAYSESTFAVYITGLTSTCLRDYETALQGGDYYTVYTEDSDYGDTLVAYSWLEDIYISAQYANDVMTVSLQKCDKGYASIANAFPSAAIASFLPASAGTVPTFAAKNNSYKLYSTEGEQYYHIEVIDANYTSATDKLEVVYATALSTAGYTVSSTKNSDGLYTAIDSSETVQILFANVGNYFEFYVGEKLTELQILPSDFNSTSYAANDGAHTSASGLAYTTSNVMLIGTDIQFKKNSAGQLYNTVAYDPIQTITIAGLTGTLTVSAGTSADNLSVVSGTDGVYNLDGATFFSIVNASSAVVKCTSITFAF